MAARNWKKVKMHYAQATDSVIYLTKNGITFSAHLMKEHDLVHKQAISFYTDDTDAYLIGFEFHDEPGLKDSLTLQNSGRGSKGGSASRTLKAQQFINSNPILKAMIRDGKQTLEVFKERGSDIFFCNLRPAFEKRIQFGEVNTIPDDHFGIYRYRDSNDNVVYIGKGRIKERAKCPDRKDWNVRLIEYSIIESDSDALRWESFYLECFEYDNAQLPAFNRVRGHGG